MRRAADGEQDRGSHVNGTLPTAAASRRMMLFESVIPRC
jgi:hypothetical protein